MLRSSVDLTAMIGPKTAYHQSEADSGAYDSVYGRLRPQELENSGWDGRQMDRPRLCLEMKKHYLWLESTIAFGEVSAAGLRGDSLSTRLSCSNSRPQWVLMARIVLRRRDVALIWPREGRLERPQRVGDADGHEAVGFGVDFGRC